MALEQTKIAKELEDFLLSLQDKPTNEDKKKIKKYASGFSKWMINSIKTATVTVAPGIPVTTAGTAAAQSGSTVSTGNGTIS